MSQLFTGSICLTDLIEQARKQHSAFAKAENGKIYFNVQTWLNDEPDKFGNTMSHALNSKKDFKEKEGKVYIGNSKRMESKEPKTLGDYDAKTLADTMDNLSF
jgi:hypothetical protein